MDWVQIEGKGNFDLTGSWMRKARGKIRGTSGGSNIHKNSILPTISSGVSRSWIKDSSAGGCECQLHFIGCTHQTRIRGRGYVDVSPARSPGDAGRDLFVKMKANGHRSGCFFHFLAQFCREQRGMTLPDFVLMCALCPLVPDHHIEYADTRTEDSVLPSWSMSWITLSTGRF